MTNRYGCNSQYESPGASGTAYGSYVMAPSGARAIEISDHATRASTLQAFDPVGRLMRLGDTPVQALKLYGANIVWLHDGVAHRAELPR